MNPTEEELALWNSGRQAEAVELYRQNSGLPLAETIKTLRLHAMGETLQSLDPYQLLLRIRALEGR